MIVKTKVFDQQLAQDIALITINKKQPYRLKGSYSRKPNGALVSDIDYTGFVRFNDGLLARIAQILSNLPRHKKFIFLRLGCGLRRALVPPWTIDASGDCSFSDNSTRMWYASIDGLVPVDVYEAVGTLLNNPKGISVATLIEVQSILHPYTEVEWSQADIQQGWKVLDGDRYSLVELMKTNATVLEFAYVPSPGEVCGVDIGLDDRVYQKGLPDIMHKYYKGDWYSIFKSFQKRLRPDRADWYRSIQKQIEPLIALRYQLELAEALHKANATELSGSALATSKMIANEAGVSWSSITTMRIEITKRVEAAVLPMLKKAGEVLRDDRIREMMYNIHRGSLGRVPASAEARLAREADGHCPLFAITATDTRILSWLAVRANILFEDMVRCYEQVAIKMQQSVQSLVRETVVDNDYRLLYRRNEVILSDGHKKISTHPVSEAPYLQAFVFVGIPKK